jgi:hypothetical protein
MLEKFLNHIVFERPSPYNRLIVVFKEESHGYDVEFAETLDGDYFVVFADAHLLAVESEHCRDARSVNIDVKKTDPLTPRGEAEGQVHRYRTFAYAAFAGKDHQGPVYPA